MSDLQRVLKVGMFAALLVGVVVYLCLRFELIVEVRRGVDVLIHVASSGAESSSPSSAVDFIKRQRRTLQANSFSLQIQMIVGSSGIPLDALSLSPDRCGLPSQIIPTTCLHATLSGTYPHIKSLLNDLQSRHPNQLILRGLRMQRRDAALGTVTAELDLLLLGAGKAAAGASNPAEAVRATP